MEIKEGFNNKPTRIRVASQANGSIELWINESGKDDKETLSYMTADELLRLFHEIQNAGKELFE